MSPQAPVSFLGLDPDEAKRFIGDRGGRPFHADVVRREVLDRGTLSYNEMTSLPRALRERLEEELPLLSGQEIARTSSADRTEKLLIRFERGGSVETVFMPSHRSERGATLCVSAQVGCPVGCPFCASGVDGLERNLLPEEIIEQFLRGRALGPISRAVVMGIGEPFLNYDNLESALDVVHDDLGIGARKITVSTVGFPERLARAAKRRPRFQLAISLHSPDDEQRAELVPAMAGVPVEDVLRAGDDWFRATGREVTYEYVLLAGTNDTPGHARRLVERLKGRRATVNLIPYNPMAESPYGRPAAAEAARFQESLTAAGIVATLRWSRGVEADAACGQLRIRSKRSQA